MPVAKSYQGLELLCEPYERDKRSYVRIRLKSGGEKEVRWYNDTEYARMYPEEKVEVKRLRSVKDVLGFEKGYITIFKGNIEAVEDWIRVQPMTRFHCAWGWYIISTDEVPQLPNEISAVRLPWESVSQPNGELKPISAIIEVVNGLINDPSPSRWQGSVGERIDRTLTVIKIVPIDGYYGSSNFYLFTDANENEYCWTTAAKQLELGTTYEVRGTVKEHQKYKGKQQTVLTRCKVG